MRGPFPRPRPARRKAMRTRICLSGVFLLLALVGLGLHPSFSFAWSTSTVDATGSSTGIRNDIATDSTPIHYIVYPYYDSSDTQIMIAYSDSDDPSTFYTDMGPIASISGGDYTSSTDIHVALDALDYPHVVFYDPAGYDLKHVWWSDDAGAWQVDTVANGTGTSDAAGEWCDIAMNGHKLYIAYTQRQSSAPTRELKIAYVTTGTAWNTLESGQVTYSTAVVNTIQDNVGLYVSMAIRSTDLWPQMVYYDASNGNLMHSYRTGAMWQKDTVVSDGDVGLYPHIALTGDKVYVTYYDQTNAKIKYITKSGGTWGSPSELSVTSGRSIQGYNDLYVFGASGAWPNMGIVYVEKDNSTNMYYVVYWWQSDAAPDPQAPDEVAGPLNQVPWCTLTTGPYDSAGDQYTTYTNNRAYIAYYSDGDCKFVWDNSGVTAVDIMDFRAAAKGKRDVELSWQTGPEPGDLLGFNIYKWQKGPDKSQKVNASLIPAQGEEMGARYTYTELRVKKRNRWSYLLEAVYSRGVTTTLGPTRVQ